MKTISSSHLISPSLRWFAACFSVFAVASSALLLNAKPTTPVAVDSAQPLRLQVEFDRDVLPAGQLNRAILRLSLRARETFAPDRSHRPPLNIALVIDKSGSMSGEKLYQAREAALEVLSFLGPQDNLAIVAYDNQVRVLVPASPVTNRARFERAIRSIEAGGNTALYGGVEQGAAEIAALEVPGGFGRIILLSDGLANVGPSSPAELARLGDRLARRGLSISTVGVGLGYNEDLMTRLAAAGDGNTYFAQSGRDLPDIFRRELGDLCQLVARDIELELNLPAGVRAVRLLGREGQVREQQVSLRLNQLYGTGDRYALVEVEVDPQRAGREVAGITAKARYAAAVGDERYAQVANARLNFTRDEAKIAASGNLVVAQSYTNLVVAEAKDEAIALADAGRREEAGSRLRQASGLLQKVSSMFASPELAAPAASLDYDAAKVEKEGLSNESRKAYRTDAYQRTNNQSKTE